MYIALIINCICFFINSVVEARSAGEWAWRADFAGEREAWIMAPASGNGSAGIPRRRWRYDSEAETWPETN